MRSYFVGKAAGLPIVLFITICIQLNAEYQSLVLCDGTTTHPVASTDECDH